MDQKISLPNNMTSEHAAHYAALQKLTEDQFDQRFVQHMVTDHQKDIRLFEQQAKQSGSGDTKLSKFTQSTLPVLREHLKIATELSNSLKGEKGTQRNAKMRPGEASQHAD